MSNVLCQEDIRYCDLITLCIPTYNRALAISEALEDLIPKISSFNLRIIVVDNHSTDNTLSIVTGFMNNYPHLSYFCQEENKGYDMNFETCLKLSKTPFTWVIGDGNRLIIENLIPLLECLKVQKPDICIVNSIDRVKNIPQQTYTSVDELLINLGWHMTLLSATIFSKKVINEANFEKYHNTYFLHFGILFEYFGNCSEFSAFWINLNLLGASPLKKLNGWNPYRVIEVFGKMWTDVVLSIPDSINMKSKMFCIQEHGKKTNLFNYKNLLKQRAVKGLTYEIYNKYKSYFYYFAPKKKYLILICSIYPNFLNKYYYRFRNQNL